MILYIVISSCLFISTSYMTYKYYTLKKNVNEFEKIGTGRIGFYEYKDSGYSFYNAYVYVNEVDRYVDGYSKIEIDNIEPINKKYSDQSKSRAKESFLTLRKTNEIEWLESEDAIKRIRKEKLEILKKL